MIRALLIVAVLAFCPPAFSAHKMPPLRLPAPAVIVAYGVGHPFPTVCAATSEWDWAGQTEFVNGAPTLVTLMPGICALLAHPLDTRLSEGVVSFALLIALHEASHVALDSQDEAVVNCRALTIFPAAVHALLPAASAAVVARMSEDARESWWRMPLSYQETDCMAAGVQP